MTKDTTDKTTNQIIAEFMGVCPEHKPNMKRWKGEYEMPCVNCEKPAVHHSSPIPGPAYDTDLNALQEVIRQATIRFGWQALEAALAVEIEKDRIQPYAGPLTGFNFAVASAKQWANALVNVIQEKAND